MWGQEDHTRERVSVLGVGAGGPYMRACECARCGGQEDHNMYSTCSPPGDVH